MSVPVEETRRAAMKVLAMELVYGVGFSVVPIYVSGTIVDEESLFSIVFSMAYFVRFHERMRIIGVCFSHTIVLFRFFGCFGLPAGFSFAMFLPVEPFGSHARVRFALTVPATYWFESNCIGFKTFLPVKVIAG